jgi:tetratricopeptide (TPR) repeat protein
VEARDLLAGRLGAGRTAAEPEVVADIIGRCARLPLALAVVCARAATHPEFPLSRLAAELRGATTGLDGLDAGDPATDIRAVFSWSLQTLSPPAVRLFRLLGLHPGPDLTAPAAASLAAVGQPEARRLLTELTRAHLLTEHVPGRYTFHDLLRAYATEQARARNSGARRRAVVHRVLDHYLHTGQRVARLLYGPWDQVDLAPALPGVVSEEPADHEQAMAWFAAEHPVLLAAIGQAAAAGFETHAWQLAWTVTNFLEQRGHWEAWAAAHGIALEAAGRVDDAAGQAHAHHGLGRAYTWLGRPEEALRHLRQALDGFAALGDEAGQARVHLNFGTLFDERGEVRPALAHNRRALELFRSAGHATGQAVALNNIGWCHALLGDHQQALRHCRQALDLHRETGDRHGEAAIWDSLGYSHHHLGNHREAIACYRRALELFRDFGDRYNQAQTLWHIGDTHDSAGDPAAAREAWRRALAILDELGHPEARQVRAKIQAVLSAS